ncbi:hypothetical protein ACFQH9_28215 [Pseudonocardia lutea]|uniref:MinD-like ATPase involved in chromosome partitioning or flagellar assembly n=1 Tax=Pseudonocardia lutea TaxID=2172015 RepID=A0ABW1IEP2_9PSEU
MLITFVSVKGSPGVSTLTLAAAATWPRPAIALDLDPQGGDLLAGLTGGAVPAEHTIVDVLLEARLTGPESALRQHVSRPVEHGPHLLAGFGTAGQANAVPWQSFAATVTEIVDADVLVDLGRFVISHPANAMLRCSDLVAVVTGTSLRAIRATARTLPALQSETDGAPTGLVIVDPGRPYSATDVSRACGMPVIGEIPFDRRAALVWTEAAPPAPRHIRSPLTQAVRAFATRVLSGPQTWARTASS